MLRIRPLDLCLLLAALTYTGCIASRPSKSLNGGSSSARHMPLVQVAEPPDRPPSLVLLTQSSAGWRQIQQGTVLNGEWTEAPGRLERLV
jgi:hypothetical protein